MHSIDACERETCASQGSASPQAGERPTVTASPVERDQMLHAVAVAQLDERRLGALRGEPRLQLARGGRVTVGPVVHDRSLYGPRRKTRQPVT